MAYTRPFTTRRFVAYGGITYSHELSLAVRVLDAFTGKQAEVPLLVYLKELRRARSFRSQSGLFCFEDIPVRDETETPEAHPDPVTKQYKLVVEPDPTTADWFYLQPQAGEAWGDGFEREITLVSPPAPPAPLPPPDPPWPRIDVTLSPKTSYPFPPNATLARGKVTAGAGNPPAGAAGVVVSCNYDQVDPLDNDKTKVVKVETQTDRAGEYVLFFQKLPDKTQQLTIIAVKNGQPDQQQPVKIAEGVTQKVDTIHFP